MSLEEFVAASTTEELNAAVTSAVESSEFSDKMLRVLCRKKDLVIKSPTTAASVAKYFRETARECDIAHYSPHISDLVFEALIPALGGGNNLDLLQGIRELLKDTRYDEAAGKAFSTPDKLHALFNLFAVNKDSVENSVEVFTIIACLVKGYSACRPLTIPHINEALSPYIVPLLKKAINDEDDIDFEELSSAFEGFTGGSYKLHWGTLYSFAKNKDFVELSKQDQNRISFVKELGKMIPQMLEAEEKVLNTTDPEEFVKSMKVIIPEAQTFSTFGISVLSARQDFIRDRMPLEAYGIFFEQMNKGNSTDTARFLTVLNFNAAECAKLLNTLAFPQLFKFLEGPNEDDAVEILLDVFKLLHEVLSVKGTDPSGFTGALCSKAFTDNIIKSLRYFNRNLIIKHQTLMTVNEQILRIIQIIFLTNKQHRGALRDFTRQEFRDCLEETIKLHALGAFQRNQTDDMCYTYRAIVNTIEFEILRAQVSREKRDDLL